MFQTTNQVSVIFQTQQWEITDLKPLVLGRLSQYDRMEMRLVRVRHIRCQNGCKCYNPH